jgi:hypothetical protein
VARTSHNRLLWTIVGVVLLAGGLAVAAASLGWLPVDRSTPLAPTSFVDRWRGWGAWAYALAIAATVLVAVFGFVLLRAELRGRGGLAMADRRFAANPDGPPGHTLVASSALAGALARDLRSHPAVRRAGVHLTAHGQPKVHVRLTVTPEADIGALHGHVDAALDRFEATIGLRPELAEVTVGIPGAGPRRVH